MDYVPGKRCGREGIGPVLIRRLLERLKRGHVFSAAPGALATVSGR